MAMFRWCVAAVILLNLCGSAISQERRATLPRQAAKQGDANAAKQNDAKAAKLTPEYPVRSKLPSDIPWYEERESGKFEGQIDRHFPVAIYTTTHYHGWQLCLEDFAIGRRSLSDCKWEPLRIAVVEPYTFRGHKDGYNDCRDNLAALVKHSGEERVREEAKRFYKPHKPWASWGSTRASVRYGKQAPGAGVEMPKGEGPKPAVRPAK